MIDLLSIIGTAASIGSIPLSIYLYIKSKEDKIDKVKREIVRTLSHQIGDRRELTSFEIQSVIASRARDEKIPAKKITENQVVEDLVAETISNPLLDKMIKEEILKELKKIYFKAELLTKIDKLEIDSRGKSNEYVEEELKQIVANREKIQVDTSVTTNKSNISETFAVVATAIGLIAFIITVLPKGKFGIAVNRELVALFSDNDTYFTFGLSIIAGILSVVISTLLKRLRK